MKFKAIEANLSGIEILDRIQRGHVVRRSCWKDDFAIRICNEDGFDENGLCIFNERQTPLYTIASDGYFFHFGYSEQGRVYRETLYYKDEYGTDTVASRVGEGLAMVFSNDWEDCGFVDASTWHNIGMEAKRNRR